VEENVKDAYGWLARNYQQGDRIYLFGAFRSPLIPVNFNEYLQVSPEGRIKYGYSLVWSMRWGLDYFVILPVARVVIDGFTFMVGWSHKDSDGEANRDVSKFVGILSAMLHKLFVQGIWPLPVYPPSQTGDERDGNGIQENLLLAGCEDPFCGGLVRKILLSVVSTADIHQGHGVFCGTYQRRCLSFNFCICYKCLAFPTRTRA